MVWEVESSLYEGYGASICDLTRPRGKQTICQVRTYRDAVLIAEAVNALNAGVARSTGVSDEVPGRSPEDVLPVSPLCSGEEGMGASVAGLPSSQDRSDTSTPLSAGKED